VKLLFVPLAVTALILFLLLLGAIGLVVSMGVLAACGRIWRLIGGGGRSGRRHGR
jgi:hypothetical protein